MTNNEIASRLVELCRQGQFEQAQKELFADDAVSVEPMATPEFEKETKGLQAIFEKSRKFDQMTEEVYSVDMSDAMVAGSSFAATMTMDMKMKGRDRMKMSELCVYTIKDGKIASEQFFM